MSKKIEVDLQMSGPLTFQFTANVPIYPEKAAFFSNKEATQGKSPLAEKLFEINNLASIRISDNTVKVSVTREFEDWSDAPNQMKSLIEYQLQSGEPAVSHAYQLSLPSEEDIKKKVKEILEKEINPAVAQHGGVIDLIDVKKNIVYIRMGGGCQGCASSLATLKQGVEQAIREKIPEVGEVLDVTDHAGGKNPYYAS